MNVPIVTHLIQFAERSLQGALNHLRNSCTATQQAQIAQLNTTCIGGSIHQRVTALLNLHFAIAWLKGQLR